MNDDELFDEKCPSLSGVLSGEFYDGNAPTDEEQARRVAPDPASPYAVDERISMEALVDDCYAALEKIDIFLEADRSRRRKGFLRTGGSPRMALADDADLGELAGRAGKGVRESIAPARPAAAVPRRAGICYTASSLSPQETH